MTSTVPAECADLPSGAQMPLVGFGTWQLRGSDARTAIGFALDVGYRHIDTATIYDNETQVGDALAHSGVARGDVFLTTKLPGGRTGEEDRTLRASLERLATDYVDLWLIHWPSGAGADVAMWRALLRALDSGRTRAVGVSNYSLTQIDELADATGVTPAVNQIKWSPLLFDREILDGHRDRGVVLEGYSALRGGTLDHPVIREVAARHASAPAQVIVRWHLQHGIVVIPKSARPERIRSNVDVASLVLSDDDMSRLDALGAG